MEYRIIIKNYAGFELYNKIVTAKDENEAIKQILSKCDTCCGDTIEIDYK